RLSTTSFLGGITSASSNQSFRRSPGRPITSRISSTPRVSELTSTPLAEKGGRNSVYWTLSRRSYLKNPRSRGRFGQPHPRSPHTRKHPRRRRTPKLIEIAQGDNFIGDKGYDADYVIQAIEAKGMNVVIPPKSNRKAPRETDFYLYKERHL